MGAVWGPRYGVYTIGMAVIGVDGVAGGGFPYSNCYRTALVT